MYKPQEELRTKKRWKQFPGYNVEISSKKAMELENHDPI